MEVVFKLRENCQFRELNVGDWFSHEPSTTNVYMKTDQPESVSICPNGTRRVTDSDAEVYRRYFKMVEL